MKNLTFLLLLSLNIFTACNQGPDLHREKEVLILLEQNRIFELREQFELYKEDLSEAVSLQVQSHLLKSFNRNEASNVAIDRLIDKYGDGLNDSLLRDLYEMKAGNYLMLFDYPSAFGTNEKLLNEYSHVMDSAFRADVETMDAFTAKFSSPDEAKSLRFRNAFAAIISFKQQRLEGYRELMTESKQLMQILDRQ